MYLKYTTRILYLKDPEIYLQSRIYKINKIELLGRKKEKKREGERLYTKRQHLNYPEGHIHEEQDQK